MRVKHIIAQTDHRPWPLPANSWLWYQEWNNAVFIHGKVDIAWLQKLVPAGLTIETFDGDAWISIVVFRMQRLRPFFLPPLSALSDFDEINIRTYVTSNGKPGVYFLSMEGNKWLSCYIAKNLSGLPYRFTPYTYTKDKLATPFMSFEYRIHEELTKKSEFITWITERYCLYNNVSKEVHRYDVHHMPWPLYDVAISNLQIQYPLLQSMDTSFIAESFQYSPGVQVIAWDKEKGIV